MRITDKYKCMTSVDAIYTGYDEVWDGDQI
jgi:hypothetical protein